MSRGALSDSETATHERRRDLGRKPAIRCLMQALWLGFLGAVLSVGLVFSVVDPLQIDVVHAVLRGSREASYTIAFLSFWLLHTIVCALACFLASTETR